MMNTFLMIACHISRNTISIVNNATFLFIDHLKNNFYFSCRKRLKLPCHLVQSMTVSSPIHKGNFRARASMRNGRQLERDTQKTTLREKKNKTTIINLPFGGTVFYHRESDTFTNELETKELQTILIVFAYIETRLTLTKGTYQSNK